MGIALQVENTRFNTDWMWVGRLSSKKDKLKYIKFLTQTRCGFGLDCMWVLPVRHARYELGKTNSNIPGLTQTRCGYGLDYTWVLPRRHES